jgi:hypothetical protein
MPVKYTKTIVCLANSRKITGRCVVGKEIAGSTIGAWIRPVSARPAGELSEEERRFQNGQDPKLLDVIRIPMVDPRPHGFQTENHLIDDGYYWTKERDASWDDLKAALDPVGGPLWDPVTERKDLAGKDGEFKVGHAILCISLGEPYGGHAYKLIAGVFLKP